MWLKYYSHGNDVDTKMMEGRDFYPVWDQTNVLVDQIKGGSPVKVIFSPQYNARFTIQYDNKIGYTSSYFIEKPKDRKPITESLNIKAKDLIQRGQADEIKWLNQFVKVRIFKSPAELGLSIIEGLENNKEVTPEIIDSISFLLKKLKTYWDGTIEDHELNQLGKYIGEVLVGILALSKNFEFEGSAFGVPESQIMSGIDSFIIGKQVVPLSHKYDAGAAAGLLNNIFKFCDDPPKGSAIYDLMHYNFNGSRDLAYRYTLDKLGLNLDPTETYRQLMDRTRNNDDHPLVVKIREVCDNQKLLDNLPWATTAFCAKFVEKALNECEKSIDYMSLVQRRKGIVQATLDPNKWYQGNIEYKILPPSDAKVKVIGWTSGFSQIEAGRGLLTYKLRKI